MIGPEPKEADSPRRTEFVAAEPEEIYDFIGDPEHLDRWWSAPDDGEEEAHFDADPSGLAVHLRWGSPGMWRHMKTRIEREGAGSRVTIEFVPVPGCGGVCLEREILRAGGWLRRIKGSLEARSHMVDSDHYWL